MPTIHLTIEIPDEKQSKVLSFVKDTAERIGGKAFYRCHDSQGANFVIRADALDLLNEQQS